MGEKYINAEWLLEEAADRYELDDAIMEAIQALIADAPKETLKPVLRSFWIKDKPAVGRKTRYICDHCGNYEYHEKNYCGKCGAVMVEQSALSEEEGGYPRGKD